MLPAMGGVLMTCAGARELVMPTKFGSPAYSATTVFEPCGSEFEANAATPPDNAPAPPILPLMRKFTVPPGAPSPGGTGLTVMVNVTFAPGGAGLTEETNTPDVAAGMMVAGAAL